MRFEVEVFVGVSQRIWTTFTFFLLKSSLSGVADSNCITFLSRLAIDGEFNCCQLSGLKKEGVLKTLHLIRPKNCSTFSHGFFVVAVFWSVVIVQHNFLPNPFCIKGKRDKKAKHIIKTKYFLIKLFHFLFKCIDIFTTKKGKGTKGNKRWDTSS